MPTLLLGFFRSTTVTMKLFKCHQPGTSSHQSSCLRLTALGTANFPLRRDGTGFLIQALAENGDIQSLEPHVYLGIIPSWTSSQEEAGGRQKEPPGAQMASGCSQLSAGAGSSCGHTKPSVPVQWPMAHPWWHSTHQGWHCVMYTSNSA